MLPPARTLIVALALAILLLLPVQAAASHPSDRSLRVLTYNIHHAAGVDGRLDLGASRA